MYFTYVTEYVPVLPGERMQSTFSNLERYHKYVFAPTWTPVSGRKGVRKDVQRFRGNSIFRSFPSLRSCSSYLCQRRGEKGPMRPCTMLCTELCKQFPSIWNILPGWAACHCTDILPVAKKSHSILETTCKILFARLCTYPFTFASLTDGRAAQTRHLSEITVDPSRALTWIP